MNGDISPKGKKPKIWEKNKKKSKKSGGKKPKKKTKTEPAVAPKKEATPPESLPNGIEKGVCIDIFPLFIYFLTFYLFDKNFCLK